MRGREKPKVSDAHGRNATNDNAGGESRQAAGKTIGEPGGIDQTNSAYSSGMRGLEQPKQKPASGAANKEPDGATAPGNRQAADTHVGEPMGHDDAGTGPRRGVADAHLQTTAKQAHEMGNDGNAVNSSESAAEGHEPEGEGILGEEDDTHINIRIPKASLKKKTPGLPNT